MLKYKVWDHEDGQTEPQDSNITAISTNGAAKAFALSLAKEDDTEFSVDLMVRQPDEKLLQVSVDVVREVTAFVTSSVEMPS